MKDLVDSAKAKTPGFGDRILGKDGAALLRSGDADGYMRVSYDRLGLPFETYDQWVASGAHLPSVKPAAH